MCSVPVHLFHPALALLSVVVVGVVVFIEFICCLCVPVVAGVIVMVGVLLLFLISSSFSGVPCFGG